MNSLIPRRLTAAVAAVALAAAGAVAVAPAAHAAPPQAPAIDYFADSIPGLRSGSVFTAVTFERFERLLKSEGTYAFLIGGPADPTTAATAAHIDAVAAQYGVDTIYTFDPRLDGDKVDVRTTSLTDISSLWTKLVADHLNKDTTPAFGNPATDPYLFIYDKSHKVGDAEDRIVAQLGGAKDAASLDSDSEVTAYRAQVSAVFDSVAVAGKVDVDTQSQFEFFHDAVNEKHAQQYGGSDARVTAYGDKILTEEDGEDFVLQSISYPELKQILNSEGDHVILFGGTWCHNTRAVVKDVNRAAAAAGVDTVYVFDLRLDGASSNDWHIRDTGSEIAYLYGDIVAEFFPNLRTQYVTSGQSANPVNYYPGGDTSVAITSAKKLQVPYLIEYNKANDAAPITKDWIRDNGNGTFREYMTEWWWVDGLPGAAKRDNQTAEAYAKNQSDAWIFANEAITKVYSFFGEAPTAPATPSDVTATAAGQDVTVSWTAPAGSGPRVTGYELRLDGGAPVKVAATATSHSFPGVAFGSHTVTVSAVNIVGSSHPSPLTTVVVAAPPVEPEPEEPVEEEPVVVVKPVVAVTGDIRAGGSIVVTGSGLPASESGVRVELQSTPQVLGTVTTTSDGAFRLTATIPSSVAAGAHSVVVFVDGVEVARVGVTVAAAPAAAPLAATGTDGIPFLTIGAALGLLAVGGVLIVRRRSHRSNA